MADANSNPGLQYEALLDSVMEETPSEVELLGRKTKIGWLHRHTQRKFTHISLAEKDEGRRNVKLCACILCNGVFAWFKPLAYALLWRWYWYVADLDDVEILKVIDASKKKIQYVPSLLLTILTTEMRDTMMATMKREAEAIRAGQAGGRDTA